MIPGMVTLRVRAEAGGVPATSELCNDILMGLRNEGTLWSDEFSVSGLKEIGSQLEMQIRIFAFTHLQYEEQLAPEVIAAAIYASAPYLRDIMVDVLSFEAPIEGNDGFVDSSLHEDDAPLEADESGE
jgi:hypothetical protein